MCSFFLFFCSFVSYVVQVLIIIIQFNNINPCRALEPIRSSRTPNPSRPQLAAALSHLNHPHKLHLLQTLSGRASPTSWKWTKKNTTFKYVISWYYNFPSFLLWGLKQVFLSFQSGFQDLNFTVTLLPQFELGKCPFFLELGEFFESISLCLNFWYESDQVADMTHDFSDFRSEKLLRAFLSLFGVFVSILSSCKRSLCADKDWDCPWNRSKRIKFSAKPYTFSTSLNKNFWILH